MRGTFAQTPAALEERCSAFVQLQAWPLLGQLDWKGWLSNFQPGELYLARCLLESFLYFNEAHASALLRHAFHALSRDVCRDATGAAERNSIWKTFLARVVITYVEGEKPSPTDSGFAFARRARIVLGIPQQRIVGPSAALDLIEQDETTPVVFLDDFLGSGKQFETTWVRPYGSPGRSFATSTLGRSCSIWYVPLMATVYGMTRIRPYTLGAIIRPAHVLDTRFSALSDESAVWPRGREHEGREFVEAASKRAGYGDSECWGFHRLALSVAIMDSIPDASLPLFYSSRSGWHPLMARR